MSLSASHRITTPGLTDDSADEDDKKEAERGKKAEKQAVDFFTRWFTNPITA